jgi:hypothetical protein
MPASFLPCLIANECSQQSDTVSVLPSIAGYVRFYSIQRNLDRLDKGIQDVEGASTPLVPVFLVFFNAVASTKAMVFAAKEHDDLKELELNVTGPEGQSSAW